jgi:hypothetical protein
VAAPVTRWIEAEDKRTGQLTIWDVVMPPPSELTRMLNALYRREPPLSRDAIWAVLDDEGLERWARRA